MRKEIKRMTLIAYDNDDVEIVDHEGFLFPPTLAVIFDDFNGCGIFNCGPWSMKELSQSLIRLGAQVAVGDVVHVSKEGTNE
jgi:hypothetical protein